MEKKSNFNRLGIVFFILQELKEIMKNQIPGITIKLKKQDDLDI